MSMTEHEKKCLMPEDHPLLSAEQRDLIKQKREQLSGLFRQIDAAKEQELTDAYAGQAEMLEGLREIYRYHGEDKHIADTCNRLIEKYGRTI